MLQIIHQSAKLGVIAGIIVGVLWHLVTPFISLPLLAYSALSGGVIGVAGGLALIILNAPIQVMPSNPMRHTIRTLIILAIVYGVLTHVAMHTLFVMVALPTDTMFYALTVTITTLFALLTATVNSFLLATWVLSKH